MGYVEKGKRKHLSGKMGNMVFFSRNGKQVIREHVIPRNPQTPAQTAHRKKFALASKIVSPLFDAMRLGHSMKQKVFGTFCGRVMREAITGEYPNLAINFNKVAIAEGPLPPPRNVRYHWNNLTQEVHLTWNSALTPEDDMGSPSDKVVVIIFNNAEPRMMRTLLYGRRRFGEITFPLYEGWDRTQTHYWIYFTSPEGTLHSRSTYATFSKEKLVP